MPPVTLTIDRGWRRLVFGEPAITHRALDMGGVVLVDGQGNTLGDEIDKWGHHQSRQNFQAVCAILGLCLTHP